MFEKDILDPFSNTRLLIKIHDIDRNIAEGEEKIGKEPNQEVADINEAVLEIGQSVRQLVKCVVASKLSKN